MLRSSRSTCTRQPGVSPGAVLGEALRLSYGPVVLTIAALCCEDKNPSKTDAPKYERWGNRRDASATVASRVSDLVSLNWRIIFFSNRGLAIYMTNIMSRHDD